MSSIESIVYSVGFMIPPPTGVLLQTKSTFQVKLTSKQIRILLRTYSCVRVQRNAQEIDIDCWRSYNFEHRTTVNLSFENLL